MNYKSIIYAFFISLTSSAISAQITITNSYFPNAGDSFKIATATSATAQLAKVTPAGGNQTWNFNFLRSDRNSTAFSTEVYKAIASDTAAFNQYPSGELIRQTDTGQVAILNRTTTKLELLGFKGVNLGAINIPGVAFRYNPPINERHAPLIYNLPTISFVSNFTATVPSSVVPDSILSRLPIRPDSIRINYRISRQDKTDAWGTVIIPGSNSAVSALRERRFEEREFRIEIKVSFFPWVDITTALGSTLGEGFRSPKDTVINYYFWSNTSKQPLVVINTNEKDSITSVRYKWQAIVAGLKNTEGVLNDVSMIVFPNPAKANEATFVEIKNWKSTDYDISIAQSDGKIVSTLRGKTPSNSDFNINIPPLPQGFYVLKITDGKGTKSVKFSLN
jgi:Secretion system C-terminal sorting domain